MKNLIKENNLRLLRSALRNERTATKSRLSELTGISVVTVQSLLDTLLALGEVQEDKIIRPQLGRPAVSYRFAERARLALVICMFEKEREDVAAYSVVDLYGNCIEQREEVCPDVWPDYFYETIKIWMEKYPEIEQIGLGLPGSQVHDTLVVSDYKALLGIDLSSYLHDRLGVPVMIENDMNAATYGFCVSHGVTEEECVVGIYMPDKYPPGAGICLKGEIIKGRNGLAGEIKYLPTGIDWNHFSYEQKAVEAFLVTASRFLLCAYNPDVLVIYGSYVDGAFAESLQEALVTDVERMMMPEIKIRPTLDEDFQTGMFHLALSEIL